MLVTGRDIEQQLMPTLAGGQLGQAERRASGIGFASEQLSVGNSHELRVAEPTIGVKPIEHVLSVLIGSG
jgi:hypothetical protein